MTDSIEALRAITDEQLKAAAILVIRWDMDHADASDYEVVRKIGDDLDRRAEAGGFLRPLVLATADPVNDIGLAINDIDTARQLVEYLTAKFNLHEEASHQ